MLHWRDLFQNQSKPCGLKCGEFPGLLRWSWLVSTTYLASAQFFKTGCSIIYENTIISYVQKRQSGRFIVGRVLFSFLFLRKNSACGKAFTEFLGRWLLDTICSLRFFVVAYFCSRLQMCSRCMQDQSHQMWQLGLQPNAADKKFWTMQQSWYVYDEVATTTTHNLSLWKNINGIFFFQEFYYFLILVYYFLQNTLFLVFRQ